jgi:transcription elongation GreA/GreB family factor
MIEVDKHELIKQLASKAKEEYELAAKASESTKSYTNSDELKQEGKYDTRAIEAGYLAGAQNKRTEELRLELQLIEELSPRSFNSGEPIAPGALVELELNGKIQTYFLCNTAGGTLLTLRDRAILVISVFSPLGSQMLDYKEGDTFEVETPKESREYTVKSVK